MVIYSLKSERLICDFIKLKSLQFITTCLIKDQYGIEILSCNFNLLMITWIY